jgi:hypothetical protein
MHDITDKRRVVKTEKRVRLLKNKPKPAAFVDLNKNFMNYQVPRDARVELHQIKNAKTGLYRTPLPGENRITLRFAKGAVRRCATGFDFNVLYLLHAEKRMQKQATITLRSLSMIVRQLGMSDDKNRSRVRAALELWTHLSIRFREYHGATGSKLFPPPITKLNISRGGPISITLHEDWNWQGRYFKRLPFPLPMQAAPHNIVLFVCAFEGKPLTLKVHTLCRKIGINHNGWLRLPHAIEQAKRWFSEHGGSLNCVIKGDDITLTGKLDPRPVKGKKKKKSPSADGDKSKGDKPRPMDNMRDIIEAAKRAKRNAKRVENVEEQGDEDDVDQYGMIIR